MLLKTADDKSKRLALLEDLQRSTLLDTIQKKWLREELMRLRKGIQGEKDSAYYLDQYFKHGVNHVVLHDLRFVVDGDVAQIDHLVINRGFGIYLFETAEPIPFLMISANALASRLAPPIKSPSTLGWARSSTALSGFTLPP